MPLPTPCVVLTASGAPVEPRLSWALGELCLKEGGREATGGSADGPEEVKNARGVGSGEVPTGTGNERRRQDQGSGGRLKCKVW